MERLWRILFKLYRRRLQGQIQVNRWDRELSAKLDALEILLGR
jgi:hypothetical protein